MPENKEIPEEEVLDEVEEGAGESGGGVLKLLKILLPVIVVSLGGGAYLAYSQYTNLAEAAVSVGIDFGYVQDDSTSEEPVEYGQFMTIDDLLINPAESSGKRFLVVSLGVESTSEAVIAELAKRDIVIRDAVLRLLSQRTVDELGAIDLRPQIKQEIRDELNGILQQGDIDRLYFTQYLLQ